jgi:hypothetical protein
VIKAIHVMKIEIHGIDFVTPEIREIFEEKRVVGS